MIRVVVAEDHRLVRHAVVVVLSQEPDIEVVSEAEHGGEAIEAVARHAPDIALLDVSMPVADGFEVAARLRREHPEVRVVFLTMHEDEATLRRAVAVGARGFVLKNSSHDELLAAIRAVARGERHLSPLPPATNDAPSVHLQRLIASRSYDEAVAALQEASGSGIIASPAQRAEVVTELTRRLAALRAELEPFEQLTPREGRVLGHLMEGHSADEIAAYEFVSLATVRTQIRAILRKLDVNSQLAAVARTRRAGWSPPAEVRRESVPA
ncbi:MAG: response regulator transcription factor [Actinomycetota bacterium]|nr:response regulator transcription factor [Actinomycetota bacterium]